MAIKNPTQFIPSIPNSSKLLSNVTETKIKTLAQTLLPGGLFRQVPGVEFEQISGGIPLDSWYAGGGFSEPESLVHMSTVDGRFFLCPEISYGQTNFSSCWLTVYDAETGIKKETTWGNKASAAYIDATYLSDGMVLGAMLTKDGEIRLTVYKVCQDKNQLLHIPAQNITIPTSFGSNVSFSQGYGLQIVLPPKKEDNFTFWVVAMDAANSQAMVVGCHADTLSMEIQTIKTQSLDIGQFTNQGGDALDLISRRSEECFRLASVGDGVVVTNLIAGADDQKAIKAQYVPIGGDVYSFDIIPMDGAQPVAFEIVPIYNDGGRDLFTAFLSTSEGMYAQVYELGFTGENGESTAHVKSMSQLNYSGAPRLVGKSFPNDSKQVLMYATSHNGFSISDIRVQGVYYLVDPNKDASVKICQGEYSYLAHDGAYPTTSWISSAAVFQLCILDDSEWYAVLTPNVSGTGTSADIGMYSLQYTFFGKDDEYAYWNGCALKSDNTPVKKALLWTMEHASYGGSVYITENGTNQGALALWHMSCRPALATFGKQIGTGILLEAADSEKEATIITPNCCARLTEVPQDIQTPISLAVYPGRPALFAYIYNIYGKTSAFVEEGMQEMLKKRDTIAGTPTKTNYQASYPSSSTGIKTDGTVALPLYQTKNLIRFNETGWAYQRSAAFIPFYPKENSLPLTLSDVDGVYVDLNQDNTELQFYRKLEDVPIHSKSN